MFTDMVTILQPRKSGTAELCHYAPDDMDVFQCQRRGQDADKNPVATLHVNGRLMMSDGPYERRTNYAVVRAATGNVLIGGLGIGMILKPILCNPDVTHVVVIEKYLVPIRRTYRDIDFMNSRVRRDGFFVRHVHLCVRAFPLNP